MVGEPGPSARSAGGPLPLAARLATDLPALVDGARRLVGAHADPRARELRRRRRLRRSAVLRSAATGVTGTATAVLATAPGLGPELVGTPLTAALAVAAAAAGERLWRASRTPLPPPAPARPPALPPRGSAARAPLARLAAAEGSVHEVLGLLARPRSGVPPVPVEALDDTAEAVRRAGAALRDTAGSLTAVERAAALAPAGRRGELARAGDALRAELDDGVAAVEGVAAAAAAALAAAGPARPTALQDAADRLSGLALGLAELPRTAGRQA